eukprot:scaffold4394_cov149-Skeletonema_menzelii.AAC.10
MCMLGKYYDTYLSVEWYKGFCPTAQLYYCGCFDGNGRMNGGDFDHLFYLALSFSLANTDGILDGTFSPYTVSTTYLESSRYPLSREGLVSREREVW